MRSKLDDSSFKTQMEPEKVFKNSVWLYTIVALLIIPLFTGVLYFSGYSQHYIFTIFSFFVCLICTLIISKFSDFVKEKIVSIITILLFFSIVSFYISLIYDAFEEISVYRFLISYGIIILSQRKYKNAVIFSISSLLVVIIGLVIFQSSVNISLLIVGMMFFSSSMAVLLAKRWNNMVNGLNKEASFMAEILNNSGIGYMIIDKDLTRIIDCNKEAQIIFGNDYKAVTQDNFSLLVGLVKNSQQSVFELDFDHNIYEVLVRDFKPVKEEQQVILKFINVTNQKKLERLQHNKKDELISETKEKLQQELLKLKSIYEHSPDIFIWNVNENLEIISSNKYFKQELLASIERKVENKMHFDELFNDRIGKLASLNFKKKLSDVFKTGLTEKLEGKLYNKEKSPTWFETYITPIFNTQNEVIELVCISHNTTEKKLNEIQTNELVSKQDILLQEIHHRVKNNLQVISSILNLQTGFVKDEGTLEILKESQNRIKSMSYIHESLYMNNDFSSIVFKDYIQNLINNLVLSYQIFDDQVSLESELDDFSLDLDESITCGLLLNEIISNALKHAFPERKNGNKLKITATENNGKVSIMVADNGIGFKEGMIPEENGSLGMQLIYTLIEQLDGNIVLSREEGIKYFITFEKQN